jgi:hypothetical protein
MKQFLIFSMLCSSIIGYAQNLVPNGDFEQYTQCPDASGNMFARYWTVWAGKPCYFNSCATDAGYSVPSNNWGRLNNYLSHPYSPTGRGGYCGIKAYSSTQPNSRDYIGVALTAPMVKGQHYDVDAVIARAAKSSNCITTKVGFHFSTVPFSTSNPLHPGVWSIGTAIIYNADTSWNQLSGGFIADSAYKYVVVGNFSDDMHTDTTHTGPAMTGGVYEANYYIDYLSVRSLSLDAYAQNDCNINCGGRIDVNAYSGQAPYTYAWSHDTANHSTQAWGLCPGTYTVSVRDSLGAFVSSTLQIVAPKKPLHDSLIITNTVGCACSGQVQVIATGGVKPYVYSWSGQNRYYTGPDSSFVNLCPGNYTLFLTDSIGCEDIGGAAIWPQSGIHPAPLSTSILKYDCNSSCSGSMSVQSHSNRPLPLFYSWNTIPVQTTDTAHNLCAGSTYIVVVSDAGGCEEKDTLQFHGADLFQVQLIDSAHVCSGYCDTLRPLVTGGHAPYTYSWSPGIQTSPSSVPVGISCNKATDTYTLTAADSAGCISIRQAKIIVDLCTGIAAYSKEDSYRLFPVPSTG